MSITKGKIYRIICLCNPTIQYVGSTFDELRYRWQNHKSSYVANPSSISIYKYFEEYGIDNFKIVLIKEYDVWREHNKDRKHLEAYEQLWINKLICCNTKNCFNINRFYTKDYRLKNKVYRSEYNKKYIEEHKEQIKEKLKIKYTCICGSITLRYNKTKHEKTKKHLKYLDIK